MFYTKPLPAAVIDSASRFRERQQASLATGCIEWVGSKTEKGYGRFYFGSTEYRAHRVAYFLHFGTIDNTLEIDHLCANTSCVNPLHMEQVTGKVNNARAALRREAEKASAAKIAA